MRALACGLLTYSELPHDQRVTVGQNIGQALRAYNIIFTFTSTHIAEAFNELSRFKDDWWSIEASIPKVLRFVLQEIGELDETGR